MDLLLKGAPVSKAIDENTAKLAAQLTADGNPPALALMGAGLGEDDRAYASSILKKAQNLGIAVTEHYFDQNVGLSDFLGALQELNGDPAVHGILIFRPLPSQLDDEIIRAALAFEKDVDGITDASLAGVFTGDHKGYAPCTAQAVMEILHSYQIPIAGKKVAVVGRSLTVGKPLAMLLTGENATVTLCHSRTADLPAACREAEILVAAAGKPALIGAEHVAEGQIVLDVGIHALPDGSLTGDVDFPAVSPIVSAITPVPGGVGGVTTSVLLSHVVQAAVNQL